MDEVYEAMKKSFYEKAEITDHGLEVITGSVYGKINWTYGCIQMNIPAHRAAWIIENGPIPDGYDIDHDPDCPKSCVTVAHLQALPHADHTSLSRRRGETINLPVYAEKSCVRCDSTFQANISNPNEQMYCTYECRMSAKNERRKTVRYPRLALRICTSPRCDKEYQPKRSDAMTCSRKCTDDIQNLRKKLRREAANVMS